MMSREGGGGRLSWLEGWAGARYDLHFFLGATCVHSLFGSMIAVGVKREGECRGEMREERGEDEPTFLWLTYSQPARSISHALHVRSEHLKATTLMYSQKNRMST